MLTNDRSLSDAQIFEVHARQSQIEKRFAQTKTVFEIAPVLLKNESRIEALFFVYFLALLVQALIERDLRLAMPRDGVETIALYPEERKTHRPTAEQVFRLFSLTQRHVLEHDGQQICSFEPAPTALQRQILDLLGVPKNAARDLRNVGLVCRAPGPLATWVNGVSVFDGDDYTRVTPPGQVLTRFTGAPPRVGMQAA